LLEADIRMTIVSAEGIRLLAQRAAHWRYKSPVFTSKWILVMGLTDAALMTRLI